MFQYNTDINILSVVGGIVNNLKGFATSVLPKLLGTVLILVAGWIVVKIIVKIIRNALNKSKAPLDASLVNFILKAVSISLKILIVLSALTNLGISTTGIVAAFSACAVAISLALKDALGNIAAGIMMLISRPFSTGDFIDVGGDSGSVLKIDLVHTTLLTPDNRQVVIPNGQLMNMTITDYSKEATRRLELKFAISYNDDPENAKTVIKNVIKSHPLSLTDPEPFVRVSEHSDNAVIITARVWSKIEDFWTLHFDLLEQVKARFDKEGISVPYNQLDVHITERK